MTCCPVIRNLAVVAAVVGGAFLAGRMTPAPAAHADLKGFESGDLKPPHEIYVHWAAPVDPASRSSHYPSVVHWEIHNAADAHPSLRLIGEGGSLHWISLDRVSQIDATPRTAAQPRPSGETPGERKGGR